MAGQAYGKLPKPVRKIVKWSLPALDAIDVITADDKADALTELGISSAIFSGNPYLAAAGVIASDIKNNSAVAAGTLDALPKEERLRLERQARNEQLKEKEERLKGDELLRDTMEKVMEQANNTEQRSEETLENLPLDRPRVGDDVLLSNNQSAVTAESPGDRASNIAKNELALKYEQDKMMGEENIEMIKKSLGYEKDSNLAKWAEANPALAQRLYEKQL